MSSKLPAPAWSWTPAISARRETRPSLPTANRTPVERHRAPKYLVIHDA